jgi:hypothetical protein
MMQNNDPGWIDTQQIFVEIAIVHDGSRTKIRTRFQNQGLAPMFVGYQANLAG